MNKVLGMLAGPTCGFLILAVGWQFSAPGILIGFLIAIAMLVMQFVTRGVAALVGLRGVIVEALVANGIFYAWMYSTCSTTGCPNYTQEMACVWHGSITACVALNYGLRRFVERRFA
ncbi:MAG: hypothetical protein AAFQ42_02765 [Pseudomonadota bacterium]